MVTMPIYTDRPRFFREAILEMDRLEDRLLRAISKSIGKAPSDRLNEIVPQLPTFWNEINAQFFDTDIVKWVTISTLTRLYPRCVQLEHYVVSVDRFYLSSEGSVSLPVFGEFRLSGDVKQRTYRNVCWIIRRSGRDDLFSLTLIPPVETSEALFEPKVVTEVAQVAAKYTR